MDSRPPHRDPNRALLEATVPLPDRRHPCRLPEEYCRATERPMVITTCTKDRAPLLTGEVPGLVIEAMLDRARRFAVRVYAYCVMPDHVHLVVTLELPKAEFMKFMRYFKAEASRRINMAGLIVGKFRWQRSYWDTFVEDCDSLAVAIQYVLENPVRKGLCARAEDWPHSAVLGSEDY